MCRLKTQCDIHTFIKCILSGDSDSNLNCPKWSSNCVCNAMHCNAIEWQKIRFCTIYGVHCSHKRPNTHTLFSHTWMGFPLSINCFLCVYSEHFRRLHSHLHSYVSLCGCVRVCMFCVCAWIVLIRSFVIHFVCIHSFFVQNPTQFNSNEKTFHAHTIESGIVNCLYGCAETEHLGIEIHQHNHTLEMLNAS